jgi:hypothetical protein
MRLLARSTVVALLVLLPSIAPAQTITFEGLGDGAGVPNGYAGLNWQNMYTLNATTYVGGNSGYNHGRVSGDMVAYNGFADPAAVLEGTSPFTLNSGWFTAAWNDGLQLDMTGYVGGVATYFASNILNTNGPSFLTFDWMNLSSVSFASSGGVDNESLSGSGEHFAVDDLTVNAEVTAAPEPASVVLLATGLLGVGVVARRRRKRSLTA